MQKLRQNITIFGLKGQAAKQEPNPEAILSHFQSVANRTVTEEGTRRIEILDKGTVFKGDVARAGESAYDLRMRTKSGTIVEAFLDKDADTLRLVPLGTRSHADREEADAADRILLKSAEVVGREEGAGRIEVAVNAGDTDMLSAAFGYGFRIVSTERIAAPSKLTLEKDLLQKPLPFDCECYRGMLSDGSLELVPDTVAVAKTSAGEVAVSTSNGPEHTYELCAKLFQNGYVGVGCIGARETAEAPMLVFRHRDSAPSTRPASLRVNVESDYGRLNEVVISYNPQTVSPKSPYSSNNKVSSANDGNVDVVAFIEEHDRLAEAMRSNGVSVLRSGAWTSDPEKSGIFSRDPTFAIGGRLVVGKMKVENRQYEGKAVESLVPARSILRIDDPDAVAEGGDVVCLGGGTVVVGLGQRTNRKGLENLARLFPDHAFIGVEHEDLHLDVLFTVAGERKVLADVEKLPQEFVAWLRGRGYEVIAADPEEQVSLGCNVLAIGDGKVIAVKENAVTNSRLRKAGVEVIEVSMPNIIKQGGGPRCMTCPTNRS